jgi:hypothetical protein
VTIFSKDGKILQAPVPGSKTEIQEVTILDRRNQVESVSKDSDILLTGWLVVLGSLLCIAWAWWQSKRESPEMRKMDEEFTQAAVPEEPAPV